jgi:hypothetical protein
MSNLDRGLVREQYSPLFESTTGVGSGFDPFTAAAASELAMIAESKILLRW